jgi:L-seryl-tRNA(Ser) seleniumtransferase
VNRIDTARLRALPQVQRLLETPEAAALMRDASREAVVDALRRALAAARADTAPVPDAPTLLARAAQLLQESRRPHLRRVINATGIVLHTNLGRAPLASAAIDAVVEAARGYANLELDLDEGRRGARLRGIEAPLAALTGAEASFAVNNCAGAVLLALAASAAGGEVIVSRGELVEIGGGFRIPEVIAQGGARLVEVGTTNKTRVADYRDAVTERTRVLLKVHPSNFRVVGFTESASLKELADLAREKNMLLIDDLGSGALAGTGETTVRGSVAAGADIVAFSGDKLLGGPQAGVLVGREAAIAPLRRHPLARALRIDKLSLAALEATLRLHLDAPAAQAHVPVLRMLAQTRAELEARAARLAALLPCASRVIASEGYSGGGTLPEEAIASAALALDAPDADGLARALRLGAPPVVGRIVAGSVTLDMLTVSDDEVPALADAVRAALG